MALKTLVDNKCFHIFYREYKGLFKKTYQSTGQTTLVTLQSEIQNSSQSIADQGYKQKIFHDILIIYKKIHHNSNSAKWLHAQRVKYDKRATIAKFLNLKQRYRDKRLVTSTLPTC